ncbi:anti-sigma factor domain-containing protein [Oceanobacillus sp. 1P07AA]|uniref:anti-sigma factor n=1 Tax=Oceanobacillus sp. 1P07AA TaxID=3132293 RepID=UPI0039A6FCCA
MTKLACHNLIDYINHQLTEEERKTFEQHLEECAECKNELDELQELMDDLPYHSNPEPVPSGMKQRVLTNVLDSEKSNNNTKKSENEVKKDNSVHMPKKKNSTWLKPVLAAVLTLSLIGNGAALYYINSGTTEEASPPIDSINQIANKYQMQASENVEANATAFLLDQNETPTLMIQADNLPELTGDETYQVWVLEGETPHRAGTFTVDQDGTGAVMHSLDNIDQYNYDTIAITKEPNANSQTPQGEILLHSAF